MIPENINLSGCCSALKSFILSTQPGGCHLCTWALSLNICHVIHHSSNSKEKVNAIIYQFHTFMNPPKIISLAKIIPKYMLLRKKIYNYNFIYLFLEYVHLHLNGHQRWKLFFALIMVWLQYLPAVFIYLNTVRDSKHLIRELPQTLAVNLQYHLNLQCQKSICSMQYRLLEKYGETKHLKVSTVSIV